jgi:uncharacterized phage protein (TIGR01671 family)
MRTIKFRAWDTRFNDMHYYADVRTWHLNTPDLEECTLMQYTGLLDKNGKEIYESDVLAYLNENSPRNGVVKGYIVYDNGAFRLKRKNKEQSHLDTITVPSYQRTHEVVGNIYEHPELIQ